jgi:hypothetical protein
MTVYLFLALSLGAPQDSPAALPESPAAIEADVHRRYLRLESLMGRLLAALKEPAKGGRLQSALARSRELLIAERLESVRGLLEKGSFPEALGEEQVLEKDLERLLLILRGEDPAQTVRDGQKTLKAIEEELQRLERLVDEQRKLNEETAAGKQGEAEKKELSERQRAAQGKVDELKRAIERRNGSAANRGEERGKKKGGESPEGQKGQEGKKAQSPPEEGQEPSDQEEGQRPQEMARGSLEKASRRMQGAAQRMEAGNEPGAMEDQEEALAQLQRAREEMEREKEQVAEERRQAAASAVLGRLQAILSEAKLVRAETETLDQKARREPGLSPETLEADGRGLARRERSLEADADDVVRILEEEGSTLVAPPILKRIKDDLENVAGLLERGEIGATTRSLETDIETALKELIDALRPPPGKRGGAGAGGEQAGGGGGGGPPKKPKNLITPAMEVRMLASAQRRIRTRTERLSEVAPGERAEQAARVAEAEAALGELTGKVQKKYHVVDSFILGAEDEDDEEEDMPGGPEKKKKKEEAHEDL